MIRLTLAVACLVLSTATSAQAQDHAGMTMKKTASVPSTQLTLTGLGGAKKTLAPADLKALPHVTVSVHNTHSNKDESYSGVAVKDLLALVDPAKGDGPHISPNVQIILASATDGFHVALTRCDTNPDCRSGQAIVADTVDGAPLGSDGAFKLILTEDRKPARWARNLESLTVESAL